MEGPRRPKGKPRRIRGRGSGRPPHLGPPTGANANPLEELHHQQFRTEPQQNSRPCNLHSCEPHVPPRSEQQSVGDFQAVVPHPPFCVETRDSPSAYRRHEQVCLPNTPQCIQYQHVYRAFEAQQNRQRFQQPLFPCGNVHAGHYSLAPEQLLHCQEEQTHRQHLTGPYTEARHVRQGASYPGDVYSCREAPLDAMRRQTNAEELRPGRASSFDNGRLSVPFAESETRIAETALPLIGERTCGDYQWPVSHPALAPEGPVEIVEPMQLGKELESFAQAWQFVTNTWLALLGDQICNADSSPTLDQVLRKLGVHLVFAECRDDSHKWDIWLSPCPVTCSFRQHLDRQTQLLDSENPQSSANLSGRQYVYSPTHLPSQDERCEISPPEESLVRRENIPEVFRSATSSGNEEPSLAGDVDETFQENSRGLAPDNFGKQEDQTIESRSRDIKTQRVALPCHNPVVDCKVSEISEQTGNEAVLTTESSEDSSLSEDMEYPPSVHELHTAAQRSADWPPSYEIALKTKHYSRVTAPPSAYNKKRDSESPVPAKCLLKFERLPSRQRATTDHVLQERSPLEGAVSPPMTMMDVDEETLSNNSGSQPTTTASPRASTSREQTVSDIHGQTHMRREFTEEGLGSQETREGEKSRDNARKSKEKKKVTASTVPAKHTSKPDSPAERPPSVAMKRSGSAWGPSKEVSRNGSQSTADHPLQVNWRRLSSQAGTPSSRSAAEPVCSEPSSRRVQSGPNPAHVSRRGNGNSNPEPTMSSQPPEHSHMHRTSSGPSGQRDGSSNNSRLPNDRQTESRSRAPKPLYSDKCRAPRK
nr:uncharacterized protein LOC129387922 [Dermacentor andersoni]